MEFAASMGGGTTFQLTHCSRVERNRIQTRLDRQMCCGDPKMAGSAFTDVASFSLPFHHPCLGPIISHPHTFPSLFSTTQGMWQTQVAGLLTLFYPLGKNPRVPHFTPTESCFPREEPGAWLFINAASGSQSQECLGNTRPKIS